MERALDKVSTDMKGAITSVYSESSTRKFSKETEHIDLTKRTRLVGRGKAYEKLVNYSAIGSCEKNLMGTIS